MIRSILLAALTATLFSSCVQDLNQVKPDNSLSGQVPAGFTFATTRTFSLQVTAQDNRGIGLKQIPLSFYYRTETDTIKMGTVITDKSGNATFQNVLPDYITGLDIVTDYPSLPNRTTVEIHSGINAVRLGGTMTPNLANTTGLRNGRMNGRTGGYAYLSTFDGQGVPNNLLAVNDYIPQDMLDLIANSLPEARPVPRYNPEYLGKDIVTDVLLKDSAEVFVTFVTEGAGYRNALGFYTYDLNKPPVSIDDIASFTIIYPNVSLTGSGGGLQPGNKVRLGNFSANTGIGWFLIPNGWTGSTVVPQKEIKYSASVLNTYSLPEYQQQSLILKDDVRKLLLLSFEDMTRPGGDNDFNDAVFFVSANPYSAVITDKMAKTKPSTGDDTDNDGVTDKNDAYPNDPQRAFDVYTPGLNVFATLSFEDNWPAKGDYDLNDMVVDYNFHYITNAANEVVNVDANLQLKAIGASYRNGFGIEFPVAPEYIESSGISVGPSQMTKTMANGMEAGQSKSVMILWDDATALMGITGFANVRNGDEIVKPTSVYMKAQFSKPVSFADLGFAPHNPFIFVNGDRTMEVHLPDMPPTSLANPKMFGASADSSKPSEGRYYRSGDNLPWAINVAQSFAYPIENAPVSDACLHFSEWAKSGGTNYKDWFLDKSGYLNGALIYKHK